MAKKFKPCLFENCNSNAAKPGSGRGYCVKHYQRLRKYGDPSFSKRDRENKSKICKVDECNKPKHSHGLCHKHLERYRRHGDPHYSYVRPSKMEWLLNNVSYSGEDCISWPFATALHGRGLVTVDGINRSAPNQMCRMAHGEPPSSRHVAAHFCGNGHLGCLNPKHLRWATYKENERDKLVHGTLRRGHAINTSKLSEVEVRQIRASKFPGWVLAELFGVQASAISSIKLRKSWAWLD